MEQHEVTTSLDWHKVRKKLENSQGNLPMFKKDVARMLHAIDLEVTKLGNLEVIARNQKSRASIKQVEEQANKINQLIRNFNKLYMFALLSQS